MGAFLLQGGGRWGVDVGLSLLHLFNAVTAGAMGKGGDRGVSLGGFVKFF